MKVFLEGMGRGEHWQSKGIDMLEGPTKKPTAAARAQDWADFVNVSDGPLVPARDSDAAAEEGDVYQPSRKSMYTPSTRPASEADGAKNSCSRTEA